MNKIKKNIPELKDSFKCIHIEVIVNKLAITENSETILSF